MTTRAELMEELFGKNPPAPPVSQGRLEVELEIAEATQGRYVILRIHTPAELKAKIKAGLFKCLEEREQPTQLFFGGSHFVFPQGPERVEIHRILRRASDGSGSSNKGVLRAAAGSAGCDQGTNGERRRVCDARSTDGEHAEPDLGDESL